MATQTPPSSSKVLEPPWDYDVFLSFRGEDTRKNFIDDLYAALERVGILTFLDEEELSRGENISTIHLNAIRGSMISIVIFSKGYASSSWSLDELLEIVHCTNYIGHTLIPIFYQVNPSDVRKQTGTFGEAFARHEKRSRTNMERVKRWRAALTEAANASGWVLVDDANGSKEINKVVEEVLDLMNVPRHPKSVDSCVKMITGLLNLGTSDIRIVGMAWMDGIVKTALTEVVYKQICDGFEGSSFLNIRKILSKRNGLVHLQEQILYDILKRKNFSIKNVDEGINLIEETIKGKRVLIVLDGVDDLKQLNALVGNSKCLGQGSRVIATSRDERLLTELEAHGKYEVEDLHYWNSHKLFSWRASIMAHTAEDYFNPEVNVYNYKQLEYLAGEGSEKQITSELEELVFDVEAVEITSNFSGLGLTKQQKYEDWKNELSNLPGNPRRPMLLASSLHKEHKLTMMPLSSLDALQILNLSGTTIRSLPEFLVRLTSLKGLILSHCHRFMELSPKVGELEQLEVLDLEGTKITDLPENLRFPKLLALSLHNNNKLTMIPPSFFNYMPALEILNLSSTDISSLPKSIVKLVSLKILILCYCYRLKELPPEVGELEQLEVLDLEGTWIMDLPPSFFNYMRALEILNLSRTDICSLPESIVRLVSLKRLILSGCHRFMELPPEVGELEQLEVLDLEGTEIRDLPENLRCPMLLELYLHNNHKLRTIPSSFFNYMPALQILNLSKTRIRSLPESIVRLVSLKRLILSYRLLSKVGELKQLEVLDLEGTEIMNLHESVIDLEGKEIMHLPDNPSHPNSLAVFLHNNHKLKTIPSSFFDYMPAVQVLNLSRTGIRSLPESIFRLVSLKILILSYCHRFLRLTPKVGELKQLEVLDLEGTEIMDLPTEIKELTNLTYLNLSFYGYMGDGSSVMESDAMVPCGVISALPHLEELMISVNPDDKRWTACVEDIVTEVCTLEKLNTLLFCFPRVELVMHFILNRRPWMFRSLSHFRFIVGHHVKRIMSRLPRDVELELERWERCLKYINGVAVPEEIKTVLQYSTAFFLERHATVKKLSDFGIGNMKQLKCCVVGECNEVEVFIDEADSHEEEDEVEAYREDGSSGIVLGSLEYIYIYYMKNLRRIWEGPVQPKCLSLLKSLTLRTCPELTTIFTTGLLNNLYNLEELTIDDCPSIKTIVSCEVSAEHKTSHILPNLKRISLNYMPGLVSMTTKIMWVSNSGLVTCH